MKRPLGKMRHRVTFYEGAQPKKDYEAADERPVEVARASVAIQPLSGRELATAREVFPHVTHQITCRHNRRIKPDQWIEWSERVFQITSVRTVDELNHTTMIMATEVA